jgi:aminopeptidase-like protein
MTENGVRESLNILKVERPELKIFDWTTPKEWNIKDAYRRG